MNTLPEPELRPDEPRRRPSTLGGLVYILVGAVTAVGLLVMAVGPWRTGVTIMGSALLAAAAARLVLADDNAGMLKVRRKSYDVVFLVVLGSLLIVLAAVVPDQPV